MALREGLRERLAQEGPFVQRRGGWGVLDTVSDLWLHPEVALQNWNDPSKWRFGAGARDKSLQAYDFGVLGSPEVQRVRGLIEPNRAHYQGLLGEWINRQGGTFQGKTLAQWMAPGQAPAPTPDAPRPDPTPAPQPQPDDEKKPHWASTLLAAPVVPISRGTDVRPATVMPLQQNPALPRPGPMSPTASNFVRSPSVNTGPPGRPPSLTSPSGAAGAGSRPTTSLAPAAAPATSPAAQQPLASPAPAASALAQPQPVAPALAQPMASAVIARTTMPTRSELASMAEGTSIRMPYGEVVRGPDGEPKLIVDEAARPMYEAAWARARRAYGETPFSGDPRAPRPEIRVGASNFNPFTGQWSRTE